MNRTDCPHGMVDTCCENYDNCTLGHNKDAEIKRINEQMKTKEEIKNEILELYGANEALRAIQNMIHAHSMEKMKQMFALNQMLKDMDDEEKNGG
jgi:hypothetical protein